MPDMPTGKALENMNDYEFAALVLGNMADKSKNPYSPKAKKLRMASYRCRVLAQRDKSAKKNWWSITYIDASGHQLSSKEMDNDELVRIGRMVTRGYACGDIMTNEEEEDCREV